MPSGCFLCGLSAVPSAFLAPIDDAYDPLLMRAIGGIALGDGSQGREVQFWTCSYDGANVNVDGELSGSGSFALPIANVLSCCLAFDSNMAVAICYTKTDGGYLYYFNAFSSQFETLYFASILSCRVAVDKTTQFFNAQSDVIFAYVADDGVVRWRQQRDRYLVEYTVGPAAPGKTLVRLGPSEDNRLQLQLLAVI